MAKNQIFFLDTLDTHLTKGRLAYGDLPVVDKPTRLQGHGREVFILPPGFDARLFFESMFRGRDSKLEGETLDLILSGADL